jgi:hypothetical protein
LECCDVCRRYRISKPCARKIACQQAGFVATVVTPAPPSRKNRYDPPDPLLCRRRGGSEPPFQRLPDIVLLYRAGEEIDGTRRLNHGRDWVGLVTRMAYQEDAREVDGRGRSIAIPPCSRISTMTTFGR